MDNTKAVRSRNMRYKRPALASMSFNSIADELLDIGEACSDVQWFVENDTETLLNALDGDDEAEYEFRMAFADVSAKSEQLYSEITGWDIRDEYDDCTVALVGNRYRTVGYDSYEEDYFSLTSYEGQLAQTESGKRLMRHTKPEMLSTIGQCLGILIAFLDVRQSYDYLKATFDILRDENTSLLKTIREIEVAYEAAAEENFTAWADSTKRFDALIDHLPERIWLD